MPASISGPLGATPNPDGSTTFTLWAPQPDRVELLIAESGKRLLMERAADGYRTLTVPGLGAGARYAFSLDGSDARPDPASRFQPDGPHGFSEVVDPGFEWTSRPWFGLPLSQYVIYELHVGTFSAAGTFEGAIEHLDYLRELGVAAVELMPIAQFPGSRNWGYDGVGLYAAQNSYGGPRGLKTLVDACHTRGMAVVLDVVYNHLGPEGNYLAEFGPYFTNSYKTPWGRALNYDGADSDHVRRFFIENALYWLTDCRIDALRMDAVHAIIDPSPTPFVEELIAAAHRRGEELNRRLIVTCESAANDPRLIRSRDLGGFGADAQWNDDFHHIVASLVSPGKGLQYTGFGPIHQMAKALRDGYVFTGEHNEFFRRRHGRSSREIPAERFVVFCQNHDQVGNQRTGERLSHLADHEACKLAAGLTILSPFVPLLFMGEEYAEAAPFLYFISHTDPTLVEAVRKGRLEEFRSFGWSESDTPPDPQSEETFNRSKLDHALRRAGRHKQMLEYYREVLRLRRTIPALRRLSKEHLEATVLEKAHALVVRRWSETDEIFLVCNFAQEPGPGEVAMPSGRWDRLIDSADSAWGGPGAAAPETLTAERGAATIHLSPSSIAAYARRNE